MIFQSGIAVVLLATALAAQPRGPRDSECLPAKNLPQKSFMRVDGLGLRFTFVWIDEIRSRFMGGYEPFDMYVVTGRVYSPFEMATGKLERPAFERLSAPSRNIQRFGPFSVPGTIAAERPPMLPFTYGAQRYQLRTIAVNASRFEDDSVTIQICREAGDRRQEVGDRRQEVGGRR
jgi:hypothetical protein